MITIYTRPRCIWCWKAKRLLRSRGLAFEVRDATSPSARSELAARTGRHTVPQIFFDDVHVGGYQDLRVRLP